MKDVIEGIEEMADKCQRVSDPFILFVLLEPIQLHLQCLC